MLRATARVHIPCDGRSLGRIIATAIPEDAPEPEPEAPELEIRAPERSDSRVIRAVRRIGARLPDVLAPLKRHAVVRPDGRTTRTSNAPRWRTGSAASPRTASTRSGWTATGCPPRPGPT